MGKLKQITPSSYIVMLGTGEKLGILIDYDECSGEDYKQLSGVELFCIGERYKLDSIKTLIEVFGEDFEIEEPEINMESSKCLDEYPVGDIELYDIADCNTMNIKTFRKSNRSQKRFYPGWWIVKNSKGGYTPRLTLSVDNYNELQPDDVTGPFKTYMEVTYTMNKLKE